MASLYTLPVCLVTIRPGHRLYVPWSFSGPRRKGPLVAVGFFKPGARKVGILRSAPVRLEVLVDAIDFRRIDAFHPHTDRRPRPGAQIDPQIRGVSVDAPIESGLKR
jgi:hypothetical protein